LTHWTTSILLAFTLVLFLGTMVILYVRFHRAQEQALADRLITLAGWARADLTLALERDGRDLEYLEWLEDAPEAQIDALQSRAQSFAEMNGLERLWVYDDNLRVLLDSAGEITPGQENPYAVLDAAWAEDALHGEAVATVSYNVEENPFQRAYIPIRSDDGEILGLLSVEGQRTYFEPMRRLRRLMFLISLMVSAALVVLAIVANRSLSRFLRLEETMNHRDRLQTLGTLAAGMAHEIRNPLGIIRVTVETLREETGSNDGGARADHDRLFSDVLEEVDRVHDLIGRFLTFARPGDDGGAEPAELATEIRHAVRLLQRAKAGQRAEIDVEIDDTIDGARTALPSASLQQVLFNLLINAQEATEARGQTTTIRVQAHRASNADSAILSVRDEGMGMTPAQLKRAGEPFRSTKPDGTGLGLSITKNLLASVQGTLEIASQPDEGTTVTVTLPLLPEKTPPRAGLE
jgi:signal transduction histidine kinase